MKIGLIFGYGIFTPDNNKYRHYLDESLKIIKENALERVILYGSFTNPQFPGISEASSMANYLVNKSPDLEERIILEEESLTTLQNIRFVLK